MPDFKLLPSVNGIDVALVDHTHPAGHPVGTPTLWLDANQIIGLSDGAAVTAWEDSSGNNNDLTQGTAGRQPVYKTDILNGFPVVRFGGDDVLSSASVASTVFFSAAAIDMFWVLKQTGANAHNTAFRFGPDASNIVMINLTYDNVIYFDHGSVGGGGRISVAQPGGWDDTWHLVELYRSAATGKIVVDDAELVSTTFSDNLDAATTTLMFGALDATGADGLNGDVAEFLLYNRALTTAERATIGDYLGSKYGLSSGATFALDSHDHSFATAVKWGTD